MNGLKHIASSLLLLVGFDLSIFAQSSIITTYAGRGRTLPVSGAQAVTQAIGGPVSVVPDATGGFYIASFQHHRIYRVGADGTLSAVAGTGIEGYGGDGGPAVAAQLEGVRDLAVDGGGNLFIADRDNGRIRKVTPDGIISTVAGIGTYGYSGDGGLATAAQFSWVEGVAADGVGNLFISDYGNNRIRKVTPAGIITTVAGNGEFGFSGDGGPATAARLSNFATGVAVDGAGNLFIADSQNNRIRKVTPAGIITTVAGNGAAGPSGDGGPATVASLNHPGGVAVDALGNLFIAEINNSRVRKVTPNGVIGTVAGIGITGFSGDGGPAKAAQLTFPFDVAAAASGDLFIADTGNDRIRRVTAAGVISTVAGNGIKSEDSDFSGDGGPATTAQLSQGVSGVAVDGAGNLFIADSQNNRIRKVTPAGIITTVAGNGEFGFSGDGGPATAASLNYPQGVAVDALGNLFTAENTRVRKVTPDGVISTVAGIGINGFSGDGGPATAAQLNSPRDVAVDRAGNVFVADSNNNRIRKITTDGVITTVAGGVTLDFYDECAGFSGDGGPATAADLCVPTGVAVDEAGNLFIADTGNARIRKVTPAGIISTVAGTGEFGLGGDGGLATAARLSSPWDMAVDGAGNLFIVDSGNQRIRKVNSAGIISTVAGDGIAGFAGDFGPAAAARLNDPIGVAVDTEGNLFIADSTNRRVRKVTFDPIGNPGEPAVISAAYPNSGPTSGNTRIRILGRKFHAGSIVRLGGVALSALIFKSAGEMVGLTPPQAAGTYSLEVIQPDGMTTLIPNAFIYRELAKVAARTPGPSEPPVWRIPFVVDSPEFRTNLGINNVGSVAAMVKISLVDSQGMLLAHASTTVPPFGMLQINHILRRMESTSTVTGREGYLILESNEDIRAWASQIDNASSDPSFVLARSDAASRVLLPSSVSNDRFATSLTVINTSATDGHVSLRLRDSAGAVLATLPNQPIQGYGYLFFEDIHKAAGLTQAFGPVEVEAHNGIRVIATAHIVSNERTGAYLEAVDVSTTGRSLVLYSLENAEFRTNLGINNLGMVTANVTVGLVDKNGVPLGSLTTTVPPGGMTQLNRINVRLGPASPGVNLEGTLRLESDQDIVAWTSQIDNLNQDSSFVVGKELQSTKLLIPSTTNMGTFRSNAVVANLDASPATIELKFRDVEGNLKASTIEIIPGNGLMSSADILDKLGMTETYGPLEILSVSGKPILARSTVYSLQRTAGTFEGVP